MYLTINYRNYFKIYDIPNERSSHNDIAEK